MAITITTSPPFYNAAYRPVIWEVNSDDANIVRVIADLYKNDVYQTTLEKDPILGTTDDFKFDPSRPIQDLLSIDLDTATSGNITHDSTNSISDFKLIFYEIINSGGVYTTTWAPDGAGTGGVVAANAKVVNTTLQHQEVQDMDAFTVDSSLKRLLTNRPTTGSKIIKGQMFFVDFLSVDIIQIFIDERRANGTTVTTQTFPTAPGLNTSENKGQFVIDTNLFDDETVRIVFRIQTSAPSSRSIVYDIDVLPNCLEDVDVIYWQNPLGGIDSHYFRGRKVEGINSEINTYEQLLSDSFSLEDRGEVVLDTTSNQQFQVVTENQSKAEMRWLREIGLNGRNAWVFNNGYVPIVIDKVTQTVVDTEEHVFKLRVDYHYANKHIAQRG